MAVLFVNLHAKEFRSFHTSTLSYQVKSSDPFNSDCFELESFTQKIFDHFFLPIFSSNVQPSSVADFSGQWLQLSPRKTVFP